MKFGYHFPVRPLLQHVCAILRLELVMWSLFANTLGERFFAVVVIAFRYSTFFSCVCCCCWYCWWSLFCFGFCSCVCYLCLCFCLISNGGFRKWVYLQMVGLNWKSHINGSFGGTPILGNPQIVVLILGSFAPLLLLFWADVAAGFLSHCGGLNVSSKLETVLSISIFEPNFFLCSWP